MSIGKVKLIVLILTMVSLFAGAVYAPYIPLFATPTLVRSTIDAEKGFMTSAGFKVTNEGMFNYGDISGLS